MILINLIKRFKAWMNLEDISKVDKAIMMLESLDMKLIRNCYSPINSLVNLNVMFPTIKEYSNAVRFANIAFKSELKVSPETYNPKMFHHIPVNRFMLDASGCYPINTDLLDNFINNASDFLILYEDCSNEKDLDYKINRNVALLTKMRNNLLDMIEFLYHVQQGSIYEGTKEEL